MDSNACQGLLKNVSRTGLEAAICTRGLEAGMSDKVVA